MADELPSISVPAGPRNIAQEHLERANLWQPHPETLQADPYREIRRKQFPANHHPSDYFPEETTP